MRVLRVGGKGRGPGRLLGTWYSGVGEARGRDSDPPSLSRAGSCMFPRRAQNRHVCAVLMMGTRGFRRSLPAVGGELDDY